MKAILLAAGKGTRISRMVQNIPKSTLPINGVPLIRRNVEIFQKNNIDTVVCVGYKKEKVIESLNGFPATYYANPFYDVTNSIASLWFAREELRADEDYIIMNADVFFSETILRMILEDPHDAVMLVDKTRRKTGDYFFSTTDNGYISKYGKDLPLQLRSCEYVGIAKISSSFVKIFLDKMEELISASQHHKWWEDTLYTLADEQKYRIYTKDVEGVFWSEIDYFDDYERVINYVAKKESEK